MINSETEYPHGFAPDMGFGMYTERCRLIKTRGGFLGWLFGKYYIETHTGHRYWASDEEFIENLWLEGTLV